MIIFALFTWIFVIGAIILAFVMHPDILPLSDNFKARLGVHDYKDGGELRWKLERIADDIAIFYQEALFIDLLSGAKKWSTAYYSPYSSSVVARSYVNIEKLRSSFGEVQVLTKKEMASLSPRSL